MRRAPLLAAIIALSLGAASSQIQAQAGTPRVERGQLARGDDTLEGGEYVDSYSFQGRPNQRVLIDLVSSDFDGYLVLVPPDGEQLENDDADSGEEDHSVIEADLDERGSYQVLVTSYEPGETGRYTLRISLGATAGSGRRADSVAIAYGQTRSGRLEESDLIEENAYRDGYAFEGRSGDRISVELQSGDFDTYLTLIPPDGAEIDNDDVDGDQDVSRIELTLAATGRYRIYATSYEDRETGAYTLTLRRSGTSSARRDDRAGGAPPARRGRLFGVFVGISDYDGDDNDLDYTADDARRIRQDLVRGAGMRQEDATLLVDRTATVASFRRAVATAGEQAGPDDLVVLFFSGHGDRVARTTLQPADPDGFDETLTFYDGDITDDELSRMLGDVRGRVLLVLDSCFSGGFSKDVISSPRRMGLFSSEEDVTSSVADKFRAGGYLARFMAEAVGDWRADQNRNGDITAIELSQYIHERYRSDVKASSRADNFVRTSGPESGYQHLVVDRGSIGPFDVLLRR